MVDADQLDGVVDVVDEVFDCSRRVAGEFFIDLGEFQLVFGALVGWQRF